MKQSRKVVNWVAVIIFLVRVHAAQAVQFEPKGKALAGILGSTKVKTKKFKQGKEQVEVFFTKEGALGDTIAVVQKGLYPPNCTHTWAIGVDSKTAKVKSIRVLEMSCPHAFPCQKESYLEQYLGKGPADAKKLQSDITTIAKATGTSNLTTDAVKRSIELVNAIKGKL
jgi:hypothetical protein